MIIQLGTDFYPTFYILDSLKREAARTKISRQASQGVHRNPLSQSVLRTLEEIKRLPEDETKNEQWRRGRKRMAKNAKMRSRKEGEDGEEINEGGGDGERRKEKMGGSG